MGRIPNSIRMSALESLSPTSSDISIENDEPSSLYKNCSNKQSKDHSEKVNLRIFFYLKNDGFKNLVMIQLRM